MKFRPIKARSGGRRDEVSRLLLQKDRAIEALLRLWLRTSDVLGNYFDEYLESE